MNFIDLFAGAGGLSDGFVSVGFNPIAHIEMNEYASLTLKTRTCYYYLKEHRRLNLNSASNFKNIKITCCLLFYKFFKKKFYTIAYFKVTLINFIKRSSI